jgi:hypothetical protein
MTILLILIDISFVIYIIPYYFEEYAYILQIVYLVGLINKSFFNSRV